MLLNRIPDELVCRAVTGVADPLSGTTITTADEVTNVRDALRDLIARTGAGATLVAGAILTADSGTAATFKALTALVNNIATTGTIHADGAISSSAGISAGSYTNGSTGAGTPQFLGASVGNSGILSSGNIATTGSGTITAAGSYNGGSTAAGTPQFLGVSLGASGLLSSGNIATTGSGSITAAGALSGASYSGGSTLAGTPQFLGVSLGLSGLLSSGNIATTGSGTITSASALSALSAAITNAITAATATLTGLCKALTFESTATTGTAPLVVASTTLVANLHAASADLANGVAALSVTDAGIATANKDGTISTPSMRTLGAGALQAAAGTHAHASMAMIDSGSYTGNGASSRDITVAFSPSLVLIKRAGSSTWIAMVDDDAIQVNVGSSNGFATVDLALNKFVVTTAAGTNVNAVAYRWVALA